MESKRIQIKRTDYIPEELEPLISNVGTNKICVVVHPDEKYVPYIQHIISNIHGVMDYYFEVKTLKDGVKPQGSNFQTIKQLLKDCVLGIVVLDGLRPNVVLEYGILLGSDKPIIVLKDNNAEIDIENLFLDEEIISKLETYRIDNPKLDIDEHLSDVKDLHWTSYNWGDPDELKEILEEDLESLKNDIISEAKKSLSTLQISNLSSSDYKKFQQAYSELVEYAIRFVIPDYEKVKALDEKVHRLANKSNVKLPSNYYFELGNIYDGLLKHDEAISSYDEAIKIDPKFAEAWYNKGIALRKLKKYEEAIKCFDEAIKIDPKFAEAWYNKGIALRKLKKYEEAIKCFDEARKIDPNYAKAWNNKGIALGKRGKLDEAIKYFDEAIKINPNYAEAWSNKGVALGKLSKLDEAIKCFDKAIKIDPNYDKAWYNKACVYALKGDKENTFKNLSKAIELDAKSKEDAKKDRDFKSLWNDKDFKRIVS